MTPTETTTAPDRGPECSAPDRCVHLVCMVCHPAPRTGDRAVCGFELDTDTPADQTREDICVVCVDLRVPHFSDHEEEL